MTTQFAVGTFSTESMTTVSTGTLCDFCLLYTSRLVGPDQVTIGNVLGKK